MSDLRELYQEIILDHGRHPRNRGPLPDATHSLEGFNPLCGDQFTVQLRVNDGGIIEEARFEGCGCAISTASASMMTQTVKGKSLSQAQTLFERFQEMVTGKSDSTEFTEPEFQKLKAFCGVCAFPNRVKCATLAWHTFRAALENRHEPVSTE